MEYRFTDTSRATTVFDLTLDDVREMRKILQAVLAGDVSEVSRWQVRGMVRKLADAQAKAAEIFEYDAKQLRKDAELGDEF